MTEYIKKMGHEKTNLPLRKIANNICSFSVSYTQWHPFKEYNGEGEVKE